MKIQAYIYWLKATKSLIVFSSYYNFSQVKYHTTVFTAYAIYKIILIKI